MGKIMHYTDITRDIFSSGDGGSRSVYNFKCITESVTDVHLYRMYEVAKDCHEVIWAEIIKSYLIVNGFNVSIHKPLSKVNKGSDRHKKGMPDLLLNKEGKQVYVELKKPGKGRFSYEQVEAIQNIKSNGGEVLICNGVNHAIIEIAKFFNCANMVRHDDPNLSDGGGIRDLL